MPIVQQAKTDRFILEYDNTIVPAQAVAQTLSQTIEADFFWLRRFYPFDQSSSPDFFTKHPTIIQFVDFTSASVLGLTPAQASSIPGRGGGWNTGGGSNGNGLIRLNPFGATNQPITPALARFLFIAEMSEQLMSFFAVDRASSRGEAYSRVLAEALVPDAGYAAECISLAPWVNPWLNTSPRPDYLNSNPASTPANKSLGTDTDIVGYGCGIIFINYLRFQLGFSLESVCGAGGTTFAEAYKNLTGLTDDPFVAVNTLLNQHFGGATINLLDNNPFPLFDNASRRVFLSTSGSTAPVAINGRFVRHVAHLAPFVGCPAKDYSYHFAHQAVTYNVTASVSGFARPIFKWFLNGAEAVFSSDDPNITLNFTTPDPADPQNPRPATGAVSFHHEHSSGAVRGQQPTGNFTITNHTYTGTYELDLRVEVSEALVADGTVSAQVSLHFEALQIVYEPRFYADARACEKKFISAVPSLSKTIDLLLNRPDPPQGRPLADAVRAVDAVRAELFRLSQTDPHLAAQANQYAANRLNIDAKTLNPDGNTVR